MKTLQCEWLTGHTAVIFQEIPEMICDVPKSSKSQENGPFHRNVWLGLYVRPIYQTKADDMLYSMLTEPRRNLDAFRPCRRKFSRCDKGTHLKRTLNLYTSQKVI